MPKGVPIPECVKVEARSLLCSGWSISKTAEQTNISQGSVYSIKVRMQRSTNNTITQTYRESSLLFVLKNGGDVKKAIAAVERVRKNPALKFILDCGNIDNAINQLEEIGELL